MMSSMIQTAAGFGLAEMPVRADDVMKLLSHVAQVKGMKAAVTNSGRGAMLTGASAFVGGILGGPPGIAVGGAVGGLIGWMTSGQFKSVPQILVELPAVEREKLCAEAMAVVKNLNWTDAAQLIALVPFSFDKFSGVKHSDSSQHLITLFQGCEKEMEMDGFGLAEMPGCADDVMKLLSYIAQVEGLEAAVKHSKRGAMLTGLSAFVGGILGGPPGIAVGGAVGGLIGWMTSSEFKSVPQILVELPDAERQKLCAKAMAVVRNIHWTDAPELIHLVMSNSILRAKLLHMLTTYLTNELKAQIKYVE